jgi:hypothetical protein
MTLMVRVQEEEQKQLNQLEFEQLDNRKKAQQLSKERVLQLQEELSNLREQAVESSVVDELNRRLREAQDESRQASQAFSELDCREWMRLKLKRLEVKKLELQNDGKELDDADQKKLVELRVNVLLIQKVSQKVFSEQDCAQLEEGVLERLITAHRSHKSKSFWYEADLDFALDLAKMRVYERKLKGKQLKEPKSRAQANELRKKLLFVRKIEQKLPVGINRISTIETTEGQLLSPRSPANRRISVTSGVDALLVVTADEVLQGSVNPQFQSNRKHSAEQLLLQRVIKWTNPEDGLRALVQLTLAVGATEVLRLQSGVLHELYNGIRLRNPEAPIFAEEQQVTKDERIKLEESVFGYFQSSINERKSRGGDAVRRVHEQFKAWPFTLPYTWWQMDKFARLACQGYRWARVIAGAKEAASMHTSTPRITGSNQDQSVVAAAGAVSPSTSSIHSILGESIDELSIGSPFGTGGEGPPSIDVIGVSMDPWVPTADSCLSEEQEWREIEIRDS